MNVSPFAASQLSAWSGSGLRGKSEGSFATGAAPFPEGYGSCYSLTSHENLV